MNLSNKSKVGLVTFVSLVVSSSLAILPLPVAVASVVILVFGTAGIYIAYRCPQCFLILAIWTYFLKFTFIFSAGGLGITPFMIFLALALAGYGLRIFTGKQRLILPIGMGFLIFFISFTTLSLLVAREIEVALGLYLRVVLDWTLMLLIIQMITDLRSLKRLLAALLLQAIIVISWGIFDAIQLMTSGLPLTDYSSFFWNQFRKNDFAVYLVFVSLLGLAILSRTRNRWEKIFAALLLTLVPVAWFITGSRSGFLALVIGLSIFSILERNGKLLRLLLSFSVLGLFTFAVFPSQERDLVLDGFRAFTNPASVIAERNVETINLRYELMEVGWEVFVSQPLFGVGFNQWQFYSPMSTYRRHPRTGEITLDPLEIHNRHLQIATNSGLFALLGYLGFVGAIIFSGLRARRNARGLTRSLLHALIASLIAGQIVLTVMTGFLWEWPIFGILVGLIHLVEVERAGDLGKHKWIKFKSYTIMDILMWRRQT